MTFRQVLHRQLEALVYQRQGAEWVVVQNRHSPVS